MSGTKTLGQIGRAAFSKVFVANQFAYVNGDLSEDSYLEQCHEAAARAVAEVCAQIALTEEPPTGSPPDSTFEMFLSRWELSPRQALAEAVRAATYSTRRSIAKRITESYAGDTRQSNVGTDLAGSGGYATLPPGSPNTTATSELCTRSSDNETVGKE